MTDISDSVTQYLEKSLAVQGLEADQTDTASILEDFKRNQQEYLLEGELTSEGKAFLDQAALGAAAGEPDPPTPPQGDDSAPNDLEQKALIKAARADFARDHLIITSILIGFIPSQLFFGIMGSLKMILGNPLGKSSELEMLWFFLRYIVLVNVNEWFVPFVCIIIVLIFLALVKYLAPDPFFYPVIYTLALLPFGYVSIGLFSPTAPLAFLGLLVAAPFPLALYLFISIGAKRRLASGAAPPLEQATEPA